MKRIFGIALMLCLVLSALSITYGDNINTLDVYLNENYVQYTSETGYPFIDDSGKVMAPFIKTLQDFGAEIIEFKDLNVLIARRGYSELGCCFGGENRIKFNFELLKESETCIVKDNITYLPLKSVFLAFDCEYNYDTNANKVSITYKQEKTFDIISPTYSSNKQEMIEFITDDNCTIYEGNYKLTTGLKPIDLSTDNKFNIIVGKEYIFSAVYPQGDCIVSYVKIKSDAEENYLNVDTKKLRDNRLRISGSTKYDSKVTINGKKYSVKDNKFSCRYKLNEGKNNIQIKSYDSLTNDCIEKTIEYTYKPEDDEEEDINDSQDPNVVKEKDSMGNDVHKISHSKKEDPKEELPAPIIHFDSLPKSSNKQVIKISGSVENADYIVINAGKSRGSKVTSNYDDKVKFEHVAILWGKDDINNQTSEGVVTFFQVFAVNKDKVTLIEGTILYTGE